MELDELKNTWMVLDERLTKQEILNESIIREMNDKKTNKSLKQLFWSDSIGIPVLLLVIPFIVYAYEKFGGKHIFYDLTLIISGVFCIAYLPFLIYRVYGLMKIDLSGKLKDNLYYINRYTIQIKREKIMMIIIGPVFFILVSLTFLEAKVDAFRWVLWICISILLVLYGYWSYSKFYNKNIQSIKNSLEELQELKEE